MTTRRRLPVASGFTLVEAIVSLAVLSLVLLATISALRTFANTQVSIDRLTGRVDEVRSVSSLLRSSLGSALTGSERSGGLSLGASESRQAYFAGSSDSAEWKTVVVFGEDYGGVFMLRVAREEGDLVLRWRDPVEGMRRVDWSDSYRKVLVQDVDEFEVSFRRKPGSDWIDSWTRQEPPVAVRFHLKSRGRYWPELVMAVQR